MDALRSEYLPISYLYSSRYGEGRAAVPVVPGQALYANFRNVAGVPAPEGVAGYSVDKLHILNILIERLRNAKTSSPEPIPDSAEGDLDALIQEYGDRIHEIAAAPSLPYSPSASITRPGMLFSFAA
jgi:hypothetical protein